MDKYSFIKVDTTKQFKLQEAKKFHISTSEARRKIIDDWHEISVVTGILDNSGSSKKTSSLSRFGSTKFMEGAKSALDSNYFAKFSMELEKLTKVLVKNQFKCSWGTITTALENAIGKDGPVKQAQSFFSQKISGCQNKNVLEAIWQVKSNYREFNDISEETFIDDDNIQRDTVIGHRMIIYNIIFKEVIMVLPEGSEFKAWLEKTSSFTQETHSKIY